MNQLEMMSGNEKMDAGVLCESESEFLAKHLQSTPNKHTQIHQAHVCTQRYARASMSKYFMFNRINGHTCTHASTYTHTHNKKDSGRYICKVISSAVVSGVTGNCTVRSVRRGTVTASEVVNVLTWLSGPSVKTDQWAYEIDELVRTTPWRRTKS